MKIDLKVLLIIKRVINLIVDINKNKEIVILSLSVSNDCLITTFKSDAFKAITIFDKILFKIEMKLNKLSTFFSTIIIYLFQRFFFKIINEKKNDFNARCF